MIELQVLRSSNTFNGLEMQNLIRVWGYYSITTLPKFPKFPILLILPKQPNKPLILLHSHEKFVTL